VVAGLVADEKNLIPIDELLKRYYSCGVPYHDQHESFVVAPEDEAEAGVMTMPLGELDLCGVVDEVPPDVLFDLIASCSGADDDAFRLMHD
jgi:ethylene-insensitive protein 3